MGTAPDNMAMKQQDLGLNLSKRRTRKAVFLYEMNLVVPWTELLSLIAPHAPRAKTGRPPFELETMLRIHFVHVWTRRLLQAFFVTINGLHTCIRLADGQTLFHARSLDEIRAFRP